MVGFMPMTERGKKHTIEEWLAQPEDKYLELIDGDFVQKAAPDIGHSLAQGGVLQSLRAEFHRKAGGSGPGGWWIGPEIDLQLGPNGFRPDVAGWRRERVPELPRSRPVSIRPDWICEVLPDSNRANDTVRKLHLYHSAGVAHYWLLDPEAGLLTVFRHAEAGYATALVAKRGEVVRAEPFDAIEVSVGVLLGDDPA